jgi:hypothetical protein
MRLSAALFTGRGARSSMVLTAEVGAELVELLGRHDHAGTVGQHRRQRRERLRQPDPDRRRVDHVDPGHRQQLALALGALEGTVPVQGLLDRLGVQRRVVVDTAVLGAVPAGQP